MGVQDDVGLLCVEGRVGLGPYVRERTRTRIVYCTSAIGHYTNKRVGGGGHGIKQGKRRNKRGGGHSHTQRITNVGTTAMSSIHTLTIKKLFSFVCGMKNKL